MISCETIQQVPPLNIEGMLEHVRLSNDIIVNEKLTTQYEELQDLGTDHLNNIDANGIYGIDDTILINLIQYTNNNYVPIININHILETPCFIRIMGYFVYRFICVDLLRYIIPKTKTLINFKSPLSLPSIDEEILRHYFLQVIKTKIDVLKDLLQQAYNDDIHQDLLKWTYYIDLCDNDLSLFIPNYLLPVCQKYEVDIIAYS